MRLLAALVALYRMDDEQRGLIVAAVQFMEGQHLAGGLQTVFRGFPSTKWKAAR